MRRFIAAAAATFLATSAGAQARNILIVNDDALSANVMALYRALEAAGHDVVVSVPCTNQSGTGAALAIGRPMPPLSAPCRNEAARAGDPGAGPMTRADLPGGDFHYVDGTPVAALLHGLHIARERWGQGPDLVISGPNEGQNVGMVTLNSGTVGAAEYAVLQGYPAVAMSAGSNSASQTLENPLSAAVAARAAELVAALDATAGGGPLLPAGLALNVNFPDRLEGAEWRASRVGTYSAYAIGFAPDMAAAATPAMLAAAKERGMTIPALPGITFGPNPAEPTDDQAHDEGVIYRTHIAVSPLGMGYAAGPEAEAMVRWRLGALK